MTRKQFDRYNRYYGETPKTSGYVEVFPDYDPIKHIGSLTIHFKTYPEDENHYTPRLIEDNYFNLPKDQGVYYILLTSEKDFQDKKHKSGSFARYEYRILTPEDYIKIPFKHIRAANFFGDFNVWKDKGGRRDSKLNYYLNQLSQ